MSAPSSLRADAALLALTAGWGAFFVIVKDALELASPFPFLVGRFLVGALFATALAARHRFERRYLRPGLILGVFLFGGFSLQTLGLALTTPSRSAFITGLYVAIVPVITLVLFRRVPRLTSLAGIALAMSGLYLLSGATPGPSARLTGDVLTLGCAVAYAIHIVLTERYAPSAPPTVLVAIQLWVVAGISAGVLPFAEQRFSLSPTLLIATALSGVFATGLAITIQTWAQARTIAVRAALIYALEPVFASACSVALGREHLGPLELWGGGLIVCGVLLGEAGGLLAARIGRARSP